jgi:hypothetical protein
MVRAPQAVQGRQLGRHSVSIFDRLTPNVSKIESLYRPPIGLSIVTGFEKTHCTVEINDESS